MSGANRQYALRLKPFVHSPNIREFKLNLLNRIIGSQIAARKFTGTPKRNRLEE
jgi:hypothetical protein